VVNAASLAVAALMLLVTACDTGQPRLAQTDRDPPAAGFVWQLPQGFPTPRVPPDNPMTTVKVALGRRLFHDPRLSGDGTVACASCHDPERAYTDGRARAVGIHDNIHPRSAMSLTNVAYNATLGWDDPALTRLEDQARVPLFNTQPPEMGVTGRDAEVLARFKGDDRYRALFLEAFPEDEDPVTIRNVTYALAAFERTLISGNSPYDRWAYGGEVDALDPEARAGARLFFSRRLNCFRCHAGFNFSGPVVYEGSPEPAARFHNTGLYNEDGRGAYPAPNTGVHRHSGRAADMGKFRAPTLRNIALTAPYMHDGSVPTLEAVLDHYAAGGRAGYKNPHAGTLPIGAATDSLVAGFALTPEDRRQLVAFLHALTDTAFVREAMENSP
jgi:cytochrome c peroxidase